MPPEVSVDMRTFRPSLLKEAGFFDVTSRHASRLHDRSLLLIPGLHDGTATTPSCFLQLSGLGIARTVDAEKTRLFGMKKAGRQKDHEVNTIITINCRTS
jgi:hypothetical protein